MEHAEKMNLMLTATCDDTNAFYQDYLRVKPEFADWCDISRCAFGKIDDNNLIELFFDVDMAKLGAWLAKPETVAMFKAHNFVPTRYTFNPLQLPTS